MLRLGLVPSIVVLSIWGRGADAHDGHHGGSGDKHYYALIDDFHTHPSLTDSQGEIFLTLNEDQTELSYLIVLDGLLGLKENPADRIDPDDIIGIHLHLHVPDTVGPHVLNIFGLATYNTPAEEDSDLLVDYEHNTLTGVWDDGDATINPETGEPYLPFYPLTSKPLTDWLDYLNSGQLMVAVHTNASGFPAMAIHGHINGVVPEPMTSMIAAALLPFVFASRFRRRRGL